MEGMLSIVFSSFANLIITTSNSRGGTLMLSLLSVLNASNSELTASSNSLTGNFVSLGSDVLSPTVVLVYEVSTSRVLLGALEGLAVEALANTLSNLNKLDVERATFGGSKVVEVAITNLTTLNWGGKSTDSLTSSSSRSTRELTSNSLAVLTLTSNLYKLTIDLNVKNVVAVTRVELNWAVTGSIGTTSTTAAVARLESLKIPVLSTLVGMTPSSNTLFSTIGEGSFGSSTSSKTSSSTLT
jgi:hypothetical protein